MIKEEFEVRRNVRTLTIESDLVVIGGGMSGVCCSLAAARNGIKVSLIQDRPVLGGNASSEVRLWILGATSHMGNNNRWAREGGCIDEILTENIYRNKEGNPIIFDTILLEKVIQERNIDLFLNTSIYEVSKSTDTLIECVTGFCSQNSTKYKFIAPLFCDASGDGIVAFQSGAPFRMGAEKKEEFEEGFAPDVADYGELLGHSMYFYTKDTGEPVRYTAPGYALKDVDKLPRIRNYKLNDHGCRLWWVEYGGRLDTIHQSEDIKWELWRFIYGLWDHVKNSGKYPEAETLTLEWVATIPGKRESRRFEGAYMLNQKDVVEQRSHYDAVAFGGWSLDLHPADGIYSDKPGCNQWHSKGVYQIPYRCYYSKSIENLFLAGRIISASHVAFGSSRVMATCSHGAQAVGVAAALCSANKIRPADLANPQQISTLQRELNIQGQSIPGIPIQDDKNLVNQARITADSELELTHLPYDGPWKALKYSASQMLPLQKDTKYTIIFRVLARQSTTLFVEFRKSSKIFNYTPDVILEVKQIELVAGEQEIKIDFRQILHKDQYGFICLIKNENVSVKTSETRVTGILSVYNSENPAVSNFGRQDPLPDLGIETFEFWVPERRPDGNNLGFRISPGLKMFSPSNLNNGYTRPTNIPNAWVAGLGNSVANIYLKWPDSQKINKLILMLDTDFDHPMESTLMGHPENVMPFCIRNYKIYDSNNNLVFVQEGNYQTINKITFNSSVITDELRIELKRPAKHVGIAVYELLCY